VPDYAQLVNAMAGERISIATEMAVAHLSIHIRMGHALQKKERWAVSVLSNRISLIPQTATTRLPLVGIGGSLVVESRKPGHFFRGIIWWVYLVGSTGFSRPPARPPVAARTRAPPRAIGSGHPAPRRGAPFAARLPCFVVAGHNGQKTENWSLRHSPGQRSMRVHRRSDRGDAIHPRPSWRR
jgi:hypothetical protein